MYSTKLRAIVLYVTMYSVLYVCMYVCSYLYLYNNTYHKYLLQIQYKPVSYSYESHYRKNVATCRWKPNDRLPSKVVLILHLPIHQPLISCNFPFSPYSRLIVHKCRQISDIHGRKKKKSKSAYTYTSKYEFLNYRFFKGGGGQVGGIHSRT